MKQEGDVRRKRKGQRGGVERERGPATMKQQLHLLIT
jgi:hypothetical protein